MMLDTDALTIDDYEAARKAVEDVLIEFRDARISQLRNNGLVIREKDGGASSIIRLGPEDAVRIGLEAIVARRVAMQGGTAENGGAK